MKVGTAAVLFMLALGFLFFGGTSLAQDQAAPPPANWGELAEALTGAWGVGLAAEPSGGNPHINALNLIGIGRAAYEMLVGIPVEEGEETPVSPDGFDPDNWEPDQELTPDFLCQLKMCVWAAAYVGLIPTYEVPLPAGPDQPLTPEEEEISRLIASAAVAEMVAIAQRDAVCENPDEPEEGPAEELCCIFYTGNRCVMGPCDLRI